jgi:(E)-4-hydroxy-3-methylbut-2-enyl-diphosphate synthase
LEEIVKEIEEKLKYSKKDISIAIMGCVVNGPGEAREADIGIAGGKGSAVLFKKGKIIKKITENEIVEALLKEIEQM